MMEKMITAMMKRYQLFAWMGLIMVLLAVWFAYSIGADANATFLSVDKATREAAATGSVLALANTALHSTTTWVPAFKFMGLGLMLGAITMVLGLIMQTLRTLGEHVTGICPAHLTPRLP